MTRRDLKQFLELKDEIIVLENQLESLRDKCDYDSQLFGVYSLTDNPEQEIERRSIELAERKKEFTVRLHDMENFIDGIEDSRVRTIFRLKYFEGWRWLSIAFRVGYSDEQRPRKIHDKYLETNC